VNVNYQVLSRILGPNIRTSNVNHASSCAHTLNSALQESDVG
jgi:hypothetical protein